MPALFVDNGKPLVEMPGVIEVACSGLARVEFIGNGQACFALYRNVLAAGAAALEQQTCLKIIAPIAAAPDAAQLLVRAAIEGGVLATAAFARGLMM